MSSVRYHAFLPPTLLPLSDFKPGSDLPERLVFLDYKTVVIETVQTQSQRRNELRPLTLLMPPGQHAGVTIAHKDGEKDANDQTKKKDEDEVMSWEDSVILPKIPMKRKSDTLDEPDHVPALPDKSVYNASRALGPRRSTRISRTSDAFMNNVTGLDATESFLSLNTTATISQQSQPPLPNWSIPLSKLVPLQSLLSGRALRRHNQGNDSQKVSLMVCVMAVDAPVKRQRKEEKAKGQEGTLWIGGWKVTVPPEGLESGAAAGGEEVACSVKLWDGMAREWSDEVIRRGDVVLLENFEFRPSTSKDPASITISSGPKSSFQPKVSILYRTLPRRTAARGDYLPPRTTSKSRNFAQVPDVVGRESRIVAEDEALRPDLRLSRSDAGVRKVSEWARWFANWVGGEPP